MEDTNIATREEMKQYAIRKLQKLNYLPQAIRLFKDDNKVMVSERTSIGAGILYEFDGEDYEKAKRAVVAIEKEHGGLVYAVVRTKYIEIGEIYACLWVGKYKDEWAYEDKLDGHKGYVFTYCYNATYPTDSEFGDIYVRPANGGLERVDNFRML